jgi:hypothetical protein
MNTFASFHLYNNSQLPPKKKKVYSVIRSQYLLLQSECLISLPACLPKIFLPGAAARQDPKDYFGRHLFKIDCEQAPSDQQQTCRLKNVADPPPSFPLLKLLLVDLMKRHPKVTVNLNLYYQLYMELQLIILSFNRFVWTPLSLLNVISTRVYGTE